MGSENTLAHDVSSRYTKSTTKDFDTIAEFVKNASTNTFSRVRLIEDDHRDGEDAAFRKSRHWSAPSVALTGRRAF